MTKNLKEFNPGILHDGQGQENPVLGFGKTKSTETFFWALVILTAGIFYGIYLLLKGL